jgi:hypothetical protein
MTSNANETREKVARAIYGECCRQADAGTEYVGEYDNGFGVTLDGSFQIEDLADAAIATYEALETRNTIAVAIMAQFLSYDDPSITNLAEECLEAAERSMAEHEAAQWRGIDSAPKDGTRIDLWVVIDGKGRRVCDVLWDSLRGLWDEYEKPFLDEEVKYWRPLPPPPA